MNKKLIVKKTVGLVAGFSVATLAGIMIRNNVPVDMKGFNKAAIVIGTFVIGSMASEKATEYMEQFVEDIAQAFEAGQRAVEPVEEPSI